MAQTDGRLAVCYTVKIYPPEYCMNQKSMSVKRLVRCAVIAALYVVLCLVLQPFSYGAVQVRVAEAFCLLPVFGAEYIIGVTLGCFLANLLGSTVIDVIFGTLATLLACLVTYKLRDVRIKGLPNTTFYVQSILCATQETVEDDAPGLSPDHIGPINQQIKALCEERGLYYLDLNAEFSDENGYLLTDYAQPDGIHLTVSGYNKWVSYLCTHTPYSKNNPYQPGSTYYLSEEMQSQLADLP